jgi:oxygen-independent coproporphyrinogen-3 oxidase
MGRLHGAKGAREAVARARTAGIANVSVDLIFGLPDHVPRDWRTDLEAAVALQVPHISLYGLTAEPGTPLQRFVASGRIEMADEDRYREEYLEAHERLRAEGYRHYEVSNFARPGFESRHNQAYWTGVPYLGFGNGAHSYLPPVRRGNLRDWSAYLDRVRAGRRPWDEEDRPESADRRVESVWLALRTDRGLSASALVTEASRLRVREWVRRGLVHPDPSRVRLTVEGWLVLDSLVIELDRSLDPVPSGG